MGWEMSLPDNKIFKKQLRSNVICPTCKTHTVQILTKKGWVCKECNTLIKNKEVKNAK